MLSELSAFGQTKHAELVFAFNWLPLMSVGYLPYREIHLRCNHRLWILIKHQQSNYISKCSQSCDCLEIQNKSDPGNCFFLALQQRTRSSVRVSKERLVLTFSEVNFGVCLLSCIGWITESQNGQGWKGPLEVMLSNPLPKAGLPRPDSFWISPRRETSQPLWTARLCAQSLSQ